MNKKALSLKDFLTSIKNVINSKLSNKTWISAEISNVSLKNHVYLELVDYDNHDKNINSKIRAVIWNNNINIVNKFKEETKGLEFGKGLKVLIEVTVMYHEIYGISLIIHKIDSTYTVGEIQLKKEDIIKKLKDENIFDKNKNLSLNKFIENIIVICPEKSAGLHDFNVKIQKLVDNNLLKVKYIYATFSGERSEKEILNAFKKSKYIAENYKVDALVILRGGGDKSEFIWLDNYLIAKEVCLFPIPIISGIGHDEDFTIIELSSFYRAATPSKCAHYITDKNYNFFNQIVNDWNYIEKVYNDKIAAMKESINFSYNTIHKNSLRLLTNTEKKQDKNINTIKFIATNKINKIYFDIERNITSINLNYKNLILRYEDKTYSIFNSFKKLSFSIIKKADNECKKNHKLINDLSLNYVEFVNNECKSRYKEIILSSPQNILKLGYCYITDDNNKAIKLAEDLKLVKKFNVNFNDGTVLASVYKPRK